MIRYHSTLIVILLCVILFLYFTYTINEGFESIPMPNEMFKKLRGLLDKYDRPEVWNHAIQMSNKTPSDLARIHIMSNM